MPVSSGVPQGSILGPLLFLLYINDLPSCVKSSKVALFADDTKLYINVNNIQDCHNLQGDLDSVMRWSETWKMNFNIKKCKILTITTKTNPVVYSYTMYDKQVQRCDNIKDIGVIIDNKLSWNSHIHTCVNKANRLMGLIKRTLGYSAPTNVSRQLYVSLVRSNLEYCCPVWSGTTSNNIVLVERVQRSATRYITHYENSNYQSRLIKLNLLPLNYRREYLDICFFFKCFNGIYNTNINKFVTFVRNNGICTRSMSDATKLQVPITNTLRDQKSYFNRIVFLWNELPSELRNIRDFKMFKLSIYSYFLNLLHNDFRCNNVCTWSMNCRCAKCRIV